MGARADTVERGRGRLCTLVLSSFIRFDAPLSTLSEQRRREDTKNSLTTRMGKSIGCQMGGGEPGGFGKGPCRWEGGGTPGGGQGVNPVRDSVNTSDSEPFKASTRCQQGVNRGCQETSTARSRSGPVLYARTLSLIWPREGRAQSPRWKRHASRRGERGGWTRYTATTLVKPRDS